MQNQINFILYFTHDWFTVMQKEYNTITESGRTRACAAKARKPDDTEEEDVDRIT